MVKRKIDIVGEEGAIPRESARATKKAKVIVFEDPASEEVEIKAVQVNSEFTESSKKKEKVKASPRDIIDLSSLPQRVSSNWKVGAHVSAAGGIENTVLNAAKIGANAFALFLKSQRKWISPPLTESSISLFKSRMKELSYNPKHILPHGSYLINLGNPDDEKREKSYECFLDDLKRCDALGLELYNFHPGSSLGIVEPSVSMAHIADCINRSHRDTSGSKVVVVLENMAGSGNIIGSDFVQLGEIISQVNDKTRVGVCLDTCHMFAAGYDIRTEQGWNSTVELFDTQVGLKYLRGMHLNDSKTDCGSKKDRHDNIGVGHLSIRTFAHILADPRMQDIPLILETPSHEESSKNWDVWAKEIEVLNLLSTSSTPNTNAASDALSSRHNTTNSIENAENPRDGTNGAHKLKLDSLAQSIKDAITTAETTGRRKKATKITPKKVAKDASASRGGKKSRRGKRKEEEEEGESE
ncbi:xylose isomerase-like protein [Lentinula edodes]|uniref:Apurinic-apyrimidinic endonuclease 1 n=1 Tax=Lentinula lateritia TaxID=40482 RepID=A0A9W9E0U1_9AGAR|nr:xylose isomerase-like protein [Lentinula edodes]